MHKKHADTLEEYLTAIHTLEEYLTAILGPGDHRQMAEYYAVWQMAEYYAVWDNMGSPLGVLSALVAYRKVGNAMFAEETE